MSIKIMTQVWKDKALKGSSRLILLALADNANDEGICWPSLKTIASKSNLSIPHVLKHLDRLDEWGYISRKRRVRGKQYTSTLYTLLIDNWEEAGEGVITTGLQGGGYKHGVITPVNTCLEGVINTGLDEPSLEPSINPAPKNGASGEDDQSPESWFDERAPVLEEKEKLTVEEMKARTAQAIQDAAERQLSGAPDLSWLNEEFVPLAVAFLRAAGRQYVPTSKERSLWRKVLREWCDIGIQPDHVRLAVDHMRKENLTIGGIQSVTKIARDRMGDGQVERQPIIPKFRTS